MADVNQLFQKGKELFDAEDYQGAVTVFSEIVQTAPEKALYHAWLARSLRMVKDNDKAILHVSRALELDSRCAIAHHVQGNICGDEGDTDRAIAAYNEAIRLDPRFAMAYSNRGSTRSDQGDLDGAIADCTEAIRLDPQNKWAYNGRGRARSDKDDWNGAIADYNEAIRLDPKFADAYGNRGYARHNKGDLDGAIADYTQAIRLAPKDTWTYNGRGLARSNKSDWDGAIADYTEAIRLDPKFALAYDNRGLARSNKGDWDGAIADHTEAIRLDPKFATAHSNRGFARSSKGDWDGAIADYTEAIHLDPKFALAYNNRGYARRDKGDLEGAIADFAQYYKYEPKQAVSSSSDNQHFSRWYQVIHQHFSRTMLPEIKRLGESFVEYWPCLLFWGKEKTVKPRMDGTADNLLRGRYGTGYVCVTDKNLRFAVFGELTKQFPLRQKSGFLGKVFEYAVRDVDETQPETNDQTWTIPWQSIIQAQPSTDTTTNQTYIKIVSGPGWEIYEHFSDTLNTILITLNMGISGKLARVLANPPGQPSAKAAASSLPAQAAPASNDVIDLLKKLNDLRISGIITDAEFEQKKKDLLSRL